MYRNFNYLSYTGTNSIRHEQAIINFFMRRVYNWMSLGLGLSAFVAWVTMSIPSVLFALINPITGAPTILFWGVLVGELALVFILSTSIQRIQVGTATISFLVYSALNGMTLGLILLAYTNVSIIKVFLVTAGTFIITSIWASTTKKDLISRGSFLTMGLFGIIIVSFINCFFYSSMVDWVVNIIGVGLFVGLTAYDSQKFRLMVQEAANEITISKMAIVGALTLYLNFVNLFLMLLRLLGDRRE